MSNVKRCDKCKKLAKDDNYLSLRIDNYVGEGGIKIYGSLDLCSKCAEKEYKLIKKIFPELGKK